MSYLFSKHLLLRMPVKKPADYLADHQIFLNDAHFLAALYLASQVFFATLERHHFQSGNLNEREGNTLQKYINRYCFRPTPFGLFASVSLIQWGEKPVVQDETPVDFAGNFHADQTYQAMAGADILDNELASHAMYAGNPSLYRVLNEYRFFRTSLDANFRQREYLLQSIAYSTLLKDLIKWCSKGRTRKEIVPYIMEAAACTLPEAEEYSGFLVDAQLLVNCLRPNISGPEYLEILLQNVNLKGIHSRRSQQLAAVLHRTAQQTSVELKAIQQLSRELKSLAPEKHAGVQNEQLSVILHRVPAEKTIDSCYQDGVRDGLYALDALSPADRMPAMERFIDSFQQHFEGQTLPLLAALDPEAGIGYQQPVAEKKNPLLETLHIPYKARAETFPEWTPAQSLLLKNWLRNNGDDMPVIQLTEEEMRSLNSGSDRQFPGMSVLFRIWEDKVLIENAGGINAPALIGRFTVANEEIEEAAKNMAMQLEQQNPHLIFAELLHLSAPHTDNVNRRKSIYAYELPVTAASVLPAENQLELGDLYVRIEQNKVVMFSKKHGKPVIPRLSSAYNHALNKLPLFRFLADLPYQYGRFNLGIDLRQFFPGQHFYPRVVYRKAILCLAMWVVSAEELETLQGATPELITGSFELLCVRIKLPAYFSLTEGDQQLVFNRDNPADVLFFCACVRQKKEAILKEFLSQPEVRQYNAYLVPVKPLIIPFTGGIPYDRPPKTKRKYMPGTDWLYLKIYAPRIGTGRLLLRLQPLLRRRYMNRKIDKWFFIRYDDHASHIRLRMKIAPEAISEVLIAFKTKLEDRIAQHVIREYHVDVYSRELERYNVGGIERTEKDFFWSSSELVLSYLQNNRYAITGNAYIFALYTTLTIVREFISLRDFQLKFLMESCELFLTEFAGDKVKVAMDKKYRELQTEIQAKMKSRDLSLWSGSVKAAERFTGILTALRQHIAADNKEQLSYLRSIIHMHLNRLFADEPRKQEMVTYYLLYKYLVSVKGREKAEI